MTIRHPVLSLPAFDPESGDLNAMVDTPKGSRNKFTFEESLGLYKLSGILPAGASFPHDFGFVPSTLGGDGDPLDVLLLMDEAAFVGCLVPARLIGVITARQGERDGAVERNDRLIAVAVKSRSHEQVRSLEDLASAMLDEIEHFFVSYNEMRGRTFEPLERKGSRAATTIVLDGVAAHARMHRRKPRAKAPSRGTR